FYGIRSDRQQVERIVACLAGYRSADVVRAGILSRNRGSRQHGAAGVGDPADKIGRSLSKCRLCTQKRKKDNRSHCAIFRVSHPLIQCSRKNQHATSPFTTNVIVYMKLRRIVTQHANHGQDRSVNDCRAVEDVIITRQCRKRPCPISTPSPSARECPLPPYRACSAGPMSWPPTRVERSCARWSFSVM